MGVPWCVTRVDGISCREIPGCNDYSDIKEKVIGVDRIEGLVDED